ncbi:MAG: leucyl/phenylalanyl-tRNA--protein transferase [Gammaproteobacteria bacterium]|jgi:leucyl/phenylalanyl-tRNA--protein transferase
MVSPHPLLWLDSKGGATAFPDVELALKEPNGLLAIGGDLSPPRLLHAYRHGIFPWYSHDQPILWWSPEPRSVLYPQRLRISRSLRRTLKKNIFTVTTDIAFRRVIEACAEPRDAAGGTWLTAEMIEAYSRLHTMGYAHSVEAWYEGELAGGIYGVSLGKIFFGESMFTRRPDASKVAFVRLIQYLQRQGFALIDCQVPSAHLASLGAETIPRRDFVACLNRYCDQPTPWAAWSDADG